MATIKQKKALVKVIENHGNVSKAMIEAGYTSASARNPSNLTNSKAWNELLEEYLPDELLTKVHKEGLDAFKIHGSPTEPDKIIPDFATRHKYLETGYKVKGKIKDENKGDDIKMVFILDV